MTAVVRARSVRDRDDAPLGLHLTMHCPGCDDLHAVWVYDPSTGTTPRTSWRWDGNASAPTINPSILVTGGSRGIRCHSFVRAGRWQFLGDSTHHLKGQTVDMVPMAAED